MKNKLSRFRRCATRALPEAARSLAAQPKPVFLVFGLHFSAVVFSMVASKVAFDRFEGIGLVELAQSLNYSAVILVLASLSIDSGLIRRFTFAKGNESDDIKSELVLLYFFGVACAIGYLSSLDALSFFEILVASGLVIIAFPFSALRAHLLANARPAWGGAGPVIMGVSSLVSVFMSDSPDELFQIMVLAQVCLTLIWIILVSLRFYYANLVSHALVSTVRSLEPTRLLKPVVKQLRFSAHSMASGLQANQAMIVARVFLVSYVGLDYAGEMEMYQRALAPIFGAASAYLSMFFYPALASRESALADGQNGLRLIRQAWIYILVYAGIYLLASVLVFPFMFWFLFGVDAELKLGLACFWISIFFLRTTGALFSSWMLAQNRVANAMLAEFLLYAPPIVLFSFSEPLIFTLEISHVEAYLWVMGASSWVYIFFLMGIMLKNRNPFVERKSPYEL